MADFLKVRFRTELPIPPEEEVEYTLSGGRVGSERKVIAAPTDAAVDVLPTPETQNIGDPVSVEVRMRPMGVAEWFAYRYASQPPGPVHQLDWVLADWGQPPTAFQGFRKDEATGEMLPIAGTIEILPPVVPDVDNPPIDPTPPIP